VIKEKLKTFFPRFVILNFLFFITALSFSASLDSLLEEGQEALDDGKEDVAEQKFSEAVSQYPESGQAHFELGNLWMNQALPRTDEKLLQKAMDECLKALQYDPGLGEAHDDLAYCYFLLKQYEKSYEHYKMASRLGVKNLYLKERLPLHLHFHERRVKAKEVFIADEEAKRKPPKTKAPLPSDDEIGGGVGR
jgi:tetratricopeptide (TPR) repeat protein